jgi:transcription initiation factor IIE alpha subunit
MQILSRYELFCIFYMIMTLIKLSQEVVSVATTAAEYAKKFQVDKIDSEMINYMTAHGKAKAGELAELVGITVPSIRYRLFQLMLKNLVGQEKTRDRQVWFFVTEKEAAASCGTR